MPGTKLHTKCHVCKNTHVQTHTHVYTCIYASSFYYLCGMRLLEQRVREGRRLKDKDVQEG